MSAQLPNATQWAERCLNDGEFMLAARYWNGGLTLNIGDEALSLPVNNGKPDSTVPMTGGVIELSAPTGVWDKVLAKVPERFHNDIMANIMQGQGMERQADPVVFASTLQWLPAPSSFAARHRSWRAQPMICNQGTFSAPVGRYVQFDRRRQTPHL